MAMMGSNGWSNQEQELQAGADEDFQQFLDLNSMSNLADGLHFDFAGFQGSNNSGGGGSGGPSMRDGIDTPMTGADSAAMTLSRTPASDSMHPAVSADAGAHSITSATSIPPSPSDAINEIDAQIQYLQQQRLQQQQRQIEEQNAAFFSRQSSMVPPTPQSMELQAGALFFDQHQQQQTQHVNQHQHQQKQMVHQQQLHQQPSQQQTLFEQLQFLNEQQDLSFTPLVSPAVTPLETHFPVDQFTMPGAYFSPLTSPALHAQTDATLVFDPRLTAGASTIDMDLETLPAPAPATSVVSASATPNTTSSDFTKKGRRNNASKNRKANVRQSPIARPQRKKTNTTPVINAQVLDQLAESLENEGLSSPVIRQPPKQYRAQQPQLQKISSISSPVVLLGPSSSSTGGTDSENGSVSPENLTDMPPPPLPKSRSTRPSPYLHPQKKAATPGRALPSTPGTLLSGSFPSPATPASLMKLASPQQKSLKVSGVSDTGDNNSRFMPGSSRLEASTLANAASTAANDHIESFELPESLSMDFRKPQEAPGKARTVPHSIHNTPLTIARASPFLEPVSAVRSGFQPLPPPAIAKASPSASASQSPRILPGGGGSGTGVSSGAATPILSAPPTTPTTLTPRKTPVMLPRASASKKRASIGSVHISPALRPKISPNLKPLLPGGAAAAEDQASRLLASKSNYQNILEGNMVPGVSYPSELSTNLTSKRTSHKIAEQGRRNRINSALQEIASLLPKPPPKDGKDGKDGSDGEDDGSGGGDGSMSGTKKDGKDGAGGINSNSNSNSTPNSKASTVEMAIEYIKQLRQEVAEATQRAEMAEKRLRLKDQGATTDK